MPDWPQFESLVTALGWTLVHFLWQGLCIAGLYALVCWLASGSRAVVRYWAGMTGFLASILMPAGTFILYYTPAGSSAAIKGGTEWSTAYALNPSISQVLSDGVEPALPIVVVLWAMGVSLLSFKAFLGWLGAYRLVHSDTHPVGDSLVRVLRDLESRLGIRQTVQILQSTKVQVPTVIGWLKPVILMPVSVVTRLPAEQVEMIIAHELSHVRRYDYAFNLLQIVIETLFFYHPAIRWMSDQVRQEREHCCDDLVVNCCKEPVIYARALANIESLRGPENAVALAATGGDLVHRVRRIVQRELPRNHNGFAQLALMLGIAVVVSLGARHGIDLGRQADDLVADRQSAVFSPGFLDGIDRDAWSQGLNAFTGLGELRESLRMQRQERQARLAAYRAAQQAAERERVAALQTRENMVPDPVLERLVIPMSPPAHDLFAQEMLASTAEYMPQRRSTDSEVSQPSLEEDDTYEVLAQSVVAPVYPFKARRKQLEGHVRLEFSISQTGEPTDIRVVDASPPETFEDSAVRALEKWAFNVDENHSEDTRVFQVFDFSMEDRGVIPAKRGRRCDITGSRICGLKSYEK